MSVAYLARRESMKLMKMGLCIFRRGFNPSKCKTWAKMATARIKLLRNKRQVVVKQMRRDVALLLESGQDATARIRVEHVIREENMMAANEIIELFCEHMVAKLSIISKQRDCPADLKEGICSLIFAGPRCSDIPELLSIRDIFQKKYGKDFVSAATDLRPESGVNRQLIEKLSAKHPSGQLKLKVMKEIAKEYQVNWDATETEEEFLKPSQDRIQGPCNFVNASDLPVVEPTSVTKQDLAEPKSVSTRSSQNMTVQSGGGLRFQDVASAAEAAARSAKDAIAAAEAAAQLANKSSTTPREYFTPATNNHLPNNTSTGEDVLGQRPSQRREFNESQSSSRSSDMMMSNAGCRWDEERDSYNKVHPTRRESFRRFDNGKEWEEEKERYNNVPPPQRESFRRYDNGKEWDEEKERYNNVPPQQREGFRRYDNGKEWDEEKESYNNVPPEQGESFRRYDNGKEWDEEERFNIVRPPQRESFWRYDNVLGGGKERDDTNDEGRVDIKFDESDCDEEIEMEPKPFGNSHDNNSNKRSSGGQEDLVSRRMSHPKLPDYDTLTARFESLKYHRSQYR